MVPLASILTFTHAVSVPQMECSAAIGRDVPIEATGHAPVGGFLPHRSGISIRLQTGDSAAQVTRPSLDTLAMSRPRRRAHIPR